MKFKIINRITIIFLLLLFIISCQKFKCPEEIETVISKAEDNRKEFEKVIKYYSKSKDSLKLKQQYI